MWFEFFYPFMVYDLIKYYFDVYGKQSHPLTFRDAANIELNSEKVVVMSVRTASYT